MTWWQFLDWADSEEIVMAIDYFKLIIFLPIMLGVVSFCVSWFILSHYVDLAISIWRGLKKLL